MEPFEKEKMLAEQLLKDIDNIIQENKLTYAQVVGVLDFIKLQFLHEGLGFNGEKHETN